MGRRREDRAPARRRDSAAATAVPDKPVIFIAPPPPPAQAKPSATQTNGRRDVPLGIVVAPDGKTFVTCSADKSVKLWSLDSPAPVRDLAQHEAIVRAMAILLDGRVLSAGDDKQIVLRSTENSKLYAIFDTKAHGDTGSVAVSQDGKTMLSSQESGSLILWSLAMGRRSR